MALILLAAVLTVPAATAGSPVCGYDPGSGLGPDQGSAPLRVGVRTPIGGFGVIIYPDGQGTCVDEIAEILNP